MSVLPSLVAAGTAAAAMGAVAVDHGIHRRSSQALDRSIYRGPDKQRLIALTFDDGPVPGSLDLLELLDREGAKATFFQCGMHAERHPEITRAVQAAGHEIGNHTWSHAQLTPRFRGGLHLPSPKMMYRELADTQLLLTDLCGVEPALFRAPYGKRWVGLDAVQRRLGLRGIQWTAIGHDWEWPAQEVAAHLLDACAPGAILCLHDGRDTQPNPDITETLGALKRMFPALRDQGYSFATVSELLASNPAPQPRLRGKMQSQEPA
ncbi:MAG TPA: polysaccharide deacetylase family protein [Acidobacteriaceae bacterium]|nr:polysaccharide deacetylase family protein [Acidobacteriaceae bacterium]